MALSKSATKQLGQVEALLIAGHHEIAARTLAPFHRCGNKQEQKAAEALRDNSQYSSILQQFTVYINGCMVAK